MKDKTEAITDSDKFGINSHCRNFEPASQFKSQLAKLLNSLNPVTALSSCNSDISSLILAFSEALPNSSLMSELALRSEIYNQWEYFVEQKDEIKWWPQLLLEEIGDEKVNFKLAQLILNLWSHKPMVSFKCCCRAIILSPSLHQRQIQ